MNQVVLGLIEGQPRSTAEAFAGRIGQIINYQSLANDVGVDSKTIKQWLSILEASFVVFKLAPYFENFGKRVIKSPKYYFTDTGLLTYRNTAGPWYIRTSQIGPFV